MCRVLLAAGVASLLGLVSAPVSLAAPGGADLQVKVVNVVGSGAPGTQVSFELLASNTGTATASAGWSVSVIVPTGASLVSLKASGGAGAETGFPCAGLTCTAGFALPDGNNARTVLVTLLVDDNATGTIRTNAYVAPNPTDPPELNALVVPTADSDPATTSTNNDTQYAFTIPSPATTTTTTTTTAAPPTTADQSASEGPPPPVSTATTTPVTPVSAGSPITAVALPATGTADDGAVVLGVVLLLSGLVIVRLSRHPRTD
jgi:LPXTG-motif cell wall-anchored protein